MVQNVTRIDKFNIPQFNVASVINYGENKNLEDISFGLKEIESLEKKLTMKLSPLDFKNDIFTLVWTIFFIIFVILIILTRYFYKKGKKINARRARKPILEDAPPPIAPRIKIIALSDKPGISIMDEPINEIN